MTAKTLLAALGLGALLLGVTASDASAHGWRGRHRHHIHRPVVRVVRPAPVVLVRPAPVVVRRAPVYVAPAPVVVAPPAPVYRPAPVVVAPPAPVVVAPAPRHDRW
jgi:hypothetical protein